MYTNIFVWFNITNCYCPLLSLSFSSGATKEKIFCLLQVSEITYFSLLPYTGIFQYSSVCRYYLEASEGQIYIFSVLFRLSMLATTCCISVSLVAMLRIARRQDHCFLLIIRQYSAYSQVFPLCIHPWCVCERVCVSQTLSQVY